MTDSPLLEMRGISKRFGGVVALNDVSLTVKRDEVVALIGENGAGKSTLMKVLGGVHAPDAGEVLINNKPVALRNVADAVAQGIGFVHQELSNLDNLSVGANMFLGREPLWAGPLKLIDRKKINADSVTPLHRLGLNVNPRTLVKQLSLAQQQMVEIAKALSQNARILVLDEPTSSLTAIETERLLATVRDLVKQGVSVIYITHRLGEICEVADRVVALRDGKNAGELSRSEIKHENMVRLMIGRELRNYFVPGRAEKHETRLRVKDLHSPAWPKQSISFDSAGGEILGFAGLVGAGRSELMQTIFGATPMISGQVSLDGKPLSICSPRDAINAGIFLAPENRRRNGLLINMSIQENITLPGLWNYTTLGLIQSKLERVESDRQVVQLRIKTPSLHTKALNLSGGNQQKVVLAKWLSLKPKVFIVDEPTRGIDVGAKAEIYRLLRGLADEGVAIIVISSDMEEVLGISDRIAVMREGAIAGFLNRDEFSEQAVMNLAFGEGQ